MSTSGYTVFDTAIGPCGLAWREHGIVGAQLPEGSPDATRARLATRFPDLGEVMPRAAARQARDAVIAALAGRQRDLTGITLDLSKETPFRQSVYYAARTIPAGDTCSYGDLARQLNKPGAARAVGQALGSNPIPIIVPCHRVLAAGGKAGGFSALGGITTKMRILRIEGAQHANQDGFEYDPLEAMQFLRAADKKLARIIDAVGPPGIVVRHTSSIFVALAQAITYQQLSGKAAATIFGRLCDLFPNGRRGLNAKNILAAKESALRGAGLSNNKMLALRDLATRAQAGEVPSLAKLRRMDDEAIIDTLTRVRGIGRWTVEMMLMNRLGRADVMAIDDLGLRQGHAVVMGRDGETERKALATYAERWRPYRSVASWYLWRAAELKRRP